MAEPQAIEKTEEKGGAEVPAPGSPAEGQAPSGVAALPEPSVPPPPPEPQVNADPQQLLGLDQAALTDLLGTPAFVRQDPPAQLWRYRGEDCRIDLFLYRDGGESGISRYVVRHFTVRAGEKPADAPEACLKAMLLARMAKQTG